MSKLAEAVTAIQEAISIHQNPEERKKDLDDAS